MSNESSPAFIITAPNARLLSPGATLVLSDDTWVVDCGFFPYDDIDVAMRHHPVARRKKPGALKHFPGHTLSLVADYSAHSYGHWLIDSITRWHIVSAAGLDHTRFDRILLPCPSETTRRMAASLPIPASKLVTEPFTGDISFDLLTTTSHPGIAGHVAAFAAPFLRSLPVTRPGPRHRRLWIARDGFRRNIANPDIIYPLLMRYGFDIIDPRHVAEIPQLCREAECVIAIEGSQAYDILFCDPGTPVLIICAPDQLTFPYPLSAAGAAGLKLHLLSCDFDDELQRSSARFDLDPTVLKQALEQLVSTLEDKSSA